MQKLVKIVSKAFRNHLHVIIIVPLLIILMTWPTFSHVFDTDGFWLAGSSVDSHMLFWDAWYGKLILSGQADFYYTDLLFYPDGVSLAFHNFSLPHMILFGVLQMIMHATSAYNLTYLLLVLATTLSAYVYLNYLFGDKWIALFGAIVVGTSAHVLGRPFHTHVSFIATIPLSLYFFHRSVLEERPKICSHRRHLDRHDCFHRNVYARLPFDNVTALLPALCVFSMAKRLLLVQNLPALARDCKLRRRSNLSNGHQP